MLTERERADRRKAIRALAASAAAVLLTVALTNGVSTDPTTEPPPELSFVRD